METKESTLLVEQQTVNDNEGKKPKKKNVFMKLHWKSKVIIILSIVLIAIVVILFANRQTNGVTLTTVSEASLQKVLEISELSTINYTYNAIATKTDGNKIEYYVAYEGTVTAGIDFEKIKIDIDDAEKKVIIKLPQIEIHSTKVNMGTMDFIFTKDKYETETTSQEAFKICSEDLEERIKYDSMIFSIAKDNAKSTIEALFKPWIDTIDHAYEVEVE